MQHKSLTAYGICDDCKEAAEPICYPIGGGFLAMHEGRLLCEDCFLEGDYQTYSDEKDEYLPRWRDLDAPRPQDVRVECGGALYRLAPVQ